MTLKIYNGFRFGTSDIRTVTVQAEAFRDRLVALHDQALLGIVVSKAVATLDRATAGLSEPSDPRGEHLPAAFQEVERRQTEVRTTLRRDPQVDFEFFIRFYVDPRDGQFLGSVHTEVAAWRDLWFQEPGITDWSFWDSTDKPDTVSKGEWEDRRTSWDRVLGYGEGSTRFSWKAEMARNDRLWEVRGASAAQIEAAVPSLDVRCNRIARILLQQRWVRDNPAPDPASQPMSGDIIGWHLQFVNYCQTPAAEIPMQECRDQARAILLPSVRADQLSAAEMPETVIEQPSLHPG